nr:sodium:solute symporter family protein [uncultured Oscillibacter sp.]
MQFNLTVTVIVVIYLLVMLFIGWYSSKKITSNTDFMVAGRRLGPFLMAGTLAATEIGGGSSLGVVQQGMQNHGLSSAWYIITMGFAFMILTFLAPKFRAATVKTVPEYFRRRYGKSAGIVTAIIMLLPLVGLTAGQFIASAVILSTMLGISYKTAVVVVAVVVTIYSVMGGLWSVTLTDFVQVFLIVICMIIAVPFGLNTAGGWSNVVANVPADTFNMFKGYTPMGVLSLTIMYVATFTVGQEAVSRYYAARDGKAARQGSVLAALVNFIYAFIPAVLGIITLALINMGKFNAADFESVGARYALPVLAMEVMPSVICGLLFAGIISATMSSSDSDLLGAGSIFANDIYHAVLKPDATSDQVMRVTQIVMCIVGVASMIIALFNTTSIVNLLMFCFTLRAAGAFFPYVLGHYWKGASLAGTIASLISGSIVVVYLEKISGGVLFGMKLSQPIIPGLIVGLVFFLVFSKIFPPKEQTCELAPEED